MSPAVKNRRGSAHEGSEEADVPTSGAEELFRDHAGFVASLLHRLGVAAPDVPDLVQEVFLLTHRKGGFENRGTAQPRTWVAAIALRLAASHRRRRRETPNPNVVESAVSQIPSPAFAVDMRESLERVQSCLDSLDEEHRAVFVLFEIEGFTGAEVAAALEVPVGTVHSRLHHARRRFSEAHARALSACGEQEEASGVD